MTNPNGLLPQDFAIAKSSDANAIRQQFQSLIRILGGQLGTRSLARSAVGLPQINTMLPGVVSPGEPGYTEVRFKQEGGIGASSHFIPDSTQQNGDSVYKSLDAQLFRFLSNSGVIAFPGPTWATFTHPRQMYWTVFKGIRHSLGRTPNGMIPIHGNFKGRMIGSAPDEVPANAPIAVKPYLGEPNSSAINGAGAGITGSNNNIWDEREFFVNATWPPNRNLAGGQFVSTSFEFFEGWLLLY